MGRGQFSLEFMYEAPKWTMSSQTMGVWHHSYFAVQMFPFTCSRCPIFVEVHVSLVPPILWTRLIHISVIMPVINTKWSEANSDANLKLMLINWICEKLISAAHQGSSRVWSVFIWRPHKQTLINANIPECSNRTKHSCFQP
jgi:phenylpyruvate tautomerase PptA (4-oxalocrotonate tautomerase family)